MSPEERDLRRKLAEAHEEADRLERDVLSGGRYGTHQRLFLVRAYIVDLTEQLAPYIRAEVANYAPPPPAETRTTEQNAQNWPYCGHIWTDSGSHKCSRQTDHTLVHRCFCGVIGDLAEGPE